MGSMQKVWTDYVRGPKALWVMYKYADIVDFELNNVTITGAKGEPLDIVFMIQTEWTNWIPRYLPNIRKLNLLNMDMEKVNVVVKKGLGVGSFGYNAHRPEPSPGQWYQSNLGLVNCKFKDTTVPTDRARVCVKYYLDVKVVDEKGNPIPDATVTVVNEVDNENHPAENIAVRRYRHVPVETCKPIDGGTWKAGANFFYFDMYSPLSSTRTGKDGHTPLPEDKTKTLVLKDYQHTQEGRKQFTYKITVQAGGKKKTITGVNPGPHWYRPDPNKPTYTITAVLDGKTVTESTLKKQGLAGLSTSNDRR
ncbi:MAG TPA: hypothetical protein EYP19_00005 [Desulfobacterales bacterium]|nr:hypothetical protein [Desulfobacterales bacterium]